MAASGIRGLGRCLFCTRALSKRKSTIDLRSISGLRSVLPFNSSRFIQIVKGKISAYRYSARVDIYLSGIAYLKVILK